MRSRKHDVDVGAVFYVVLGGEGADRFADGQDELVSFFTCFIVKGFLVDRVGGFDDAGTCVAGPSRQPLPKLFGQEGHKGVNHGEATFESGIQRLLGGVLLLRSAVLNDGFGVFNIHVTKIGVPILVACGGGIGKFAGSEAFVDLFAGDGEFMKNPQFAEGFMAGAGGGVGKRFEVTGEFAKNIFGGLVDFVAEAAVSVHYFYIKVDVSTYTHQYAHQKVFLCTLGSYLQWCN